MKEGSKSIMKKLIPQFTSQITIKGGIKVVPILSGIVGTSVDVLMTHAIAKVAKQTFLKTTIKCESFVRMEEERIKLLINMGIVDMYFCNEEKTLILEIIKNSSIPDSKKDVFCRDIENSPSKLYSLYTFQERKVLWGKFNDRFTLYCLGRWFYSSCREDIFRGNCKRIAYFNG